MVSIGTLFYADTNNVGYVGFLSDNSDNVEYE
jgi:hypothetical protein